MTVSLVRLAELEALCEAASPGEWEARLSHGDGRRFQVWADGLYIFEDSFSYACNGDAEFIAASRAAMPLLIDGMRVLEQIADPSYVGNYGLAETVGIYRAWAANALAKLEGGA